MNHLESNAESGAGRFLLRAAICSILWQVISDTTLKYLPDGIALPLYSVFIGLMFRRYVMSQIAAMSLKRGLSVAPIGAFHLPTPNSDYLISEVAALRYLTSKSLVQEISRPTAVRPEQIQHSVGEVQGTNF